MVQPDPAFSESPLTIRALFDSAPIGIAVFAADLRHVHVNATYERLTGQSASVHLGRGPADSLGAGGAPLAGGLAQALQTGRPAEVFTNFTDPSGEERHCVAVCWPIAGSGGPEVALMMRDITERARLEMERRVALDAEQRLRQEAERQRDFVRLVLEHAPLGISVCEGPDYRLTMVNEFALRIVGMDREALIGRPIAETFPEAFAVVRELYDRAYYRGETVTAPARLIPLPDGRQVWSYACYAPLRAADGSAIGVMSLGLDVTDLKQAQLLLESQKRVLELIATGQPLDTVFEAVVTAVADHSMRGVLPAIQIVTDDGRRLRPAAAPLLPAPFVTALDGLPVAPNAACCGRAAFLGERVIVSDVLTDPLWTAHRDLAVTFGIRACCSTPIRDSGGRVVGTMALYSRTPGAPAEEDLAVVELMVRAVALAIERQRADGERARLLEAERHAREAAERASRTKDEFVATLSHELRTPLNAILGWTRMLRAGELDTETSARALDAIERNTRAQSQLVEDLLDISRIITGKLRLDVRSVELSRVVEAAVDAFRPAAEAKQIRVEQIVDPRAAPISGDPDRLQQVVWNLLSNAVKFTPKGGRVQVRLERVNSHVEIIVSDTGRGIAPSLLPHVFDRFSQGTERGERAGGLGLGLAIARHLVELHGGTIQVASDGTDLGATFTVKLPLMVVRSERPGTEVHPAASDRLASTLLRLAPIRVLVVEDDEDGREIVTHILSHAGADVRAVESVAAGFPLVQEWQPQLVISDIEMPGEDGYSFISRVRQLPGCSGRELPAIALTAYARAEDRIRALAAGFQMHVPKPVDPAELIAVIRAVVPQAAAT
ncbi:MAG TPA: ATP-binding protein [Vicinamibacterales bacterium]|nr:ATP-binding protein [Vicinamibacterales bacterium]